MNYTYKDYVKAILLKGKGQKEEIIELNAENALLEIYNYLGSKNEYHIDIDGLDFGVHNDYQYIAYWNTENKTNTCMEITKFAGAPYPIFIDSPVIIICHCFEDGGYLVDINVDDVKEYFNTENAFWALVKLN